MNEPASERLEAPFGRFIDRQKPLSFTFDSASYAGYEGDVIASALAATCRRSAVSETNAAVVTN